MYPLNRSLAPEPSAVIPTPAPHLGNHHHRQPQPPHYITTSDLPHLSVHEYHKVRPPPPTHLPTTYSALPPAPFRSPKLTATSTMAGAHPIHIHPARPLYRVSAKLLGASMWFWVMYRAKKDGVRSILAKLGRGRGELIVGCVGCVDGVETSLGALERSARGRRPAYCNRQRQILYLSSRCAKTGSI